MAFSIRLTDEERLLAESQAERAFFEKIEDEFDLNVAQEAYEEYVANKKESRPINQLWEECDL